MAAQGSNSSLELTSSSGPEGGSLGTATSSDGGSPPIVVAPLGLGEPAAECPLPEGDDDTVQTVEEEAEPPSVVYTPFLTITASGEQVPTRRPASEDLRRPRM